MPDCGTVTGAAVTLCGPALAVTVPLAVVVPDTPSIAILAESWPLTTIISVPSPLPTAHASEPEPPQPASSSATATASRAARAETVTRPTRSDVYTIGIKSGTP